jgi:hypothetical protein
VDTTATYNTTVTNLVANVSQAVATGDRIALKVATPAWVTNPTSLRFYAYVYIE